MSPMPELEQFTATLNMFAQDLSAYIEAADQDQDTSNLGFLLDGIRQTIAALLLCEFECERVLARG